MIDEYQKSENCHFRLITELKVFIDTYIILNTSFDIKMQIIESPAQAIVDDY